MRNDEYIIQNKGKLYKGTMKDYFYYCRCPLSEKCGLPEATANDLIEYNKRCSHSEITNRNDRVGNQKEE